MADVAERPSLILSADEIKELTGYVRPHAQLMALRAQGFHRARLNAAGFVVLERAHYQAVCSGQDGAHPQPEEPMLRSQRRRLHAA